LHGETVADLPTQIASAELVLNSAGIQTTVAVDPGRVPAAARQLLAVVVREAVTNILRHSDARSVSITFEDLDPCPTLVIVNDGAGQPQSGSSVDTPPFGTGLSGLAAQCAAAGGRLLAGPTGDERFEIRVELSRSGTGSQ
jgi:two-component system sensor histidine kinase DesK